MGALAGRRGGWPGESVSWGRGELEEAPVFLAGVELEGEPVPLRRREAERGSAFGRRGELEGVSAFEWRGEWEGESSSSEPAWGEVATSGPSLLAASLHLPRSG